MSSHPKWLTSGSDPTPRINFCLRPKRSTCLHCHRFKYAESRLAYFTFFKIFAWTATSPAESLDGGKVSLQVAYHTESRPLDHRIMDMPSSIFPSGRRRPEGSSRKRHLLNLVKGGCIIMRKPFLAQLAAQPGSTKLVNICFTVSTRVWLTQGCSKA